MRINMLAKRRTECVLRLIKPPYQQQTSIGQGHEQLFKGRDQLRHAFVARESSYEPNHGSIAGNLQSPPDARRPRRKMFDIDSVAASASEQTQFFRFGQ